MSSPPVTTAFYCADTNHLIAVFDAGDFGTAKAIKLSWVEDDDVERVATALYNGLWPYADSAEVVDVPSSASPSAVFDPAREALRQRHQTAEAHPA